MAVELGTALAKESGCQIIYKSMKWSTAVRSLEKGGLDLLLNLSYTEEREKFASFIGPARDESMVIAVLENSNYIINSLDDIKKLPMQIGIMKGASYGTAFDSKLKTDRVFAKNIMPVNNLIQNIKKLKRNRLSGFIMDHYDLAYKVKNEPLYQGLKIHSFFVNQNEVFFGFSKKSVSPEMLAILQRAYIRVRAKGIFKKIVMKYQ